MASQDLLLRVFCLIDDELKALGPPRSSGPQPTLSDSEVVTIELVGELWGIADDKALYGFFRRYHAAEFPAPRRVHRTTFARQAANLCWIKRLLQRRLAERLGGGPLWLVDRLLLPANRFARARTCRRFAGQAGWGFDPVAVKAFYGSRRHRRTSPYGAKLGYQLAPADAAETEVIWEATPGPPETDGPGGPHLLESGVAGGVRGGR